MFEELYETLTPQQADTYLARIGEMARPEAPTLVWLDELLDRHQQAIPFETVDIFDYHLPISTELSHLYDKVVLRRRGGYCFELNTLLMALLRTCGYEAWPCACRILRGGDTLRPVLHQAVMVRLDGTLYFCDVGYGGAMYPGALPLTEGRALTKGGTTFHWEGGDPYWWKLFYHTRPILGENGEQHASQPRLEMLVSLYPSAPVDFELPNRYCSTDPASPFVAHRMAYLRQTDGQIALKDMEFSQIHGLHRTSRTLRDTDEVRAVLKDDFGILME